MKCFNTVKKDKRVYTNFVGMNFCTKFVNSTATKYRKYYFNKLIRTYRFFNPVEYTMEHEFYFLNFMFLKLEEKDDCRFFYLFGKYLIKKISLKSIIKKLYFKLIDKKHDHLYILNANSGEIYLFLTYLFDAICNKNGSKSPLLIATKKYHIDMIKMICPEIPYIFIPKFYQNIIGDEFYIDNFRFIKIFSPEHFYKVEQEAKKNPINLTHYFTSIIETLGLSKDDIKIRTLSVSKEAEKSMLKKIENIGLDINNFVFISPEANSCEYLTVEFWQNIINNAINQRYDVFVNLQLADLDLGDVTYKTCNLSFEEAFALVKRSKKLYALRSGFIEFLLQTEVPMEVYYTPFRANNITAEQILSEFGLMKIPDAKKELITEKIIDLDAIST